MQTNSLSPTKQVKKTALYHNHLKLGANMQVFGGYEMPMWYPAGAKSEHLAVLTSAGLFDTSHMAIIRMTGEDSRELLQSLFSKDLGFCCGGKQLPLAPGRCVYGVFCDESGCPLDDALLYMLARNHYLIVVNSGMGFTISEHLRSHGQGKAIKIEDLSDQVGKLDLQGPDSPRILAGLLADGKNLLSGINYFTFRGDWQADDDDEAQSRSGINRRPAARLFSDKSPLLVSRTGYTGELGFEIFCSLSKLEMLWSLILEAGEPYGLLPCGLAARDSLRTGAMLPLSSQDIGKRPFVNHPWTFALPFTPDKRGFTKSFLGDKALLASLGKGKHTYAFIGKDPRKISPGPTSEVFYQGGKIGRVLSCVTDTALGIAEGRVYSVNSPQKPEGLKLRGLACGFIEVEMPLANNSELSLSDGKRSISVNTCEDIRPDRSARAAIGITTFS